MGFQHDITIIKPHDTALVKDISSPVTGLGWLDDESWTTLRKKQSSLKLLGLSGSQAVQSLMCNLHSDIIPIGQGIFRNKRSAPSQRTGKSHTEDTWIDFVSQALLYRIFPDLKPATGYSGVAVCAEGTRTDRTAGLGVIGLQSFVQMAGPIPTDLDMDESDLKKRLERGRVAFYGAFKVPDVLKREYTII